MRALRTRPGWELSRSGGLAGTWSGGPGPVPRPRARRRQGPGEDAIAGMTIRESQDSRAESRGAGAGRDADRAVTALYLTHYRPLVRIAALLVQDLATAEEIVQDSFVAVHAAWRRLPDADHALSYLRRSVVDRSRAALRQHVVVDKLAPRLAPDLPSGHGEASIEVERSAFISALWTLPAGSGRSWCCGTSPTCPRPRSPRQPASARARSRPTPPGPCPGCETSCARPATDPVRYALQAEVHRVRFGVRVPGDVVDPVITPPDIRVVHCSPSHGTRRAATVGS